MPMDEAREWVRETPGWTLLEGRLRREFVTPDFVTAMALVNRVAELAEREQHHPDLHVTQWNHVAIEIWTHAVGGLHVNDFVLARKIGEIAAGSSG